MCWPTAVYFSVVVLMLTGKEYLALFHTHQSVLTLINVNPFPGASSPLNALGTTNIWVCKSQGREFQGLGFPSLGAHTSAGDSGFWPLGPSKRASWSSLIKYHNKNNHSPASHSSTDTRDLRDPEQRGDTFLISLLCCSFHRPLVCFGVWGT